MKALFRPTLLTAIALVLATALILSPKPTSAQAQGDPRAQAAPAPAPAAGPDKSQNELRQENQRLREKIAELDAQVAESKRRIAKLEDTIRSLSTAQAAKPAPASSSPAKPGATPAAAPPPADAQLPDDPYAAPDAMAALLEKEFAQSLGNKPREGDAEMDRYVREAKRWTRQVAQTRRKPVEWTVQVVDPLAKKAGAGGAPEPATSTTGGEATFVVVNPVTHATLGGPFKVTLSAHDFAKLREEPKSGLWALSGVFGATPEVVYPESTEPKLYPPRLIGPFVEYHYEFVVKAFSAYAPQAPAEPAMK